MSYSLKDVLHKLVHATVHASQTEVEELHKAIDEHFESQAEAPDAAINGDDADGSTNAGEGNLS